MYIFIVDFFLIDINDLYYFRNFNYYSLLWVSLCVFFLNGGFGVGIGFGRFFDFGVVFV